MNRVLLLLWLAAGPTLDFYVYSDDGRCGGVCLVSGNVDGGSCHVGISASPQPNKEQCKAALEKKCAVLKPPPGGCYLGRDGQPNP